MKPAALERPPLAGGSDGPARGRPDGVDALARRIVGCRICRERPLRAPLPHEPRPILRVSAAARIVIASQAPGLRAHASGVPFDDASGRRLRDWMATEPAIFYDRERIAIVPMGFCFPGHDANKGDQPPRPECRATWHADVFAALPRVELILAVGLHAIRYHAARLRLPVDAAAGLTDIVAGWRDFGRGPGPRVIPLPHPSWRNTAWIRRNPWFEADLVPVVRQEVSRWTTVCGLASFRPGSGLQP